MANATSLKEQTDWHKLLETINTKYLPLAT